MTSRDFCFWFQGFLEVGKPQVITAEQVDLIQRHLNLVFVHEIDPSYTPDQKKQEIMNQIHGGFGIPNDQIVGPGPNNPPAWQVTNTIDETNLDTMNSISGFMNTGKFDSYLDNPEQGVMRC